MLKTSVSSVPPWCPLFFALIALAGCQERRMHTFGAQRWDPARGCLEKGAVVDVVAGADPGTCASTRCWQASDGEVWVTTTACDAPPDYVDATTAPAGSPCAQALLALAKGVVCPADDAGVVAKPDAGEAPDAQSDAAAP